MVTSTCLKHSLDGIEMPSTTEKTAGHRPASADRAEGVIVMTTLGSPLSNRDRAVLRAVAEGRCTICGAGGTALRVDGLHCSDQFAGARLAAAGLIAVPGPVPGPARLTSSGHALLAAA
jgi:hypothetical protein